MKKLFLGLSMMLLAAACDSGLDVNDDEVQGQIAGEMDDVVTGTQGTDGDVSTDSVNTDTGVNTSMDTALDDTSPQVIDTVAGTDASTDGSTGNQTDSGSLGTDPAVDTDSVEQEMDTAQDSEVAEIVDTAGNELDTETGEDTVASDEMPEETDDSEIADTNDTSEGDENLDENDDAGADTASDTMEDDVIDDSDNDVADTGTGTDIETCTPTLVINEVDFDVPGKDTAEFVELYNPTDCPMPISGLSLVLVNGSNMEEYRRISLTDSGVDLVEAGDFLVIHGTDLALSASVPQIVMSYANGFIQNGPDGLAIYDEAAGVILDAFCYGAAMSEVIFKGVDGAFSLVEGEINPELTDTDDAGVSISRIPDGVDSQNAAMDWALSVATPGESNALLPQ